MSPETFEKISRLPDPYYEMGVESLKRIMDYKQQNFLEELNKRKFDLDLYRTESQMDIEREKLDLYKQEAALNRAKTELEIRKAKKALEDESYAIEAEDVILKNKDKIEKGDYDFVDSIENPMVRVKIRSLIENEKNNRAQARLTNSALQKLYADTLDDDRVQKLTGGSYDVFASLYGRDPVFTSHVMDSINSKHLYELGLKAGVPLSDLKNIINNPETGSRDKRLEIMDLAMRLESLSKPEKDNKEIEIPVVGTDVAFPNRSSIKVSELYDAYLMDPESISGMMEKMLNRMRSDEDYAVAVINSLKANNKEYAAKGLQNLLNKNKGRQAEELIEKPKKEPKVFIGNPYGKEGATGKVYTGGEDLDLYVLPTPLPLKR